MSRARLRLCALPLALSAFACAPAFAGHVLSVPLDQHTQIGFKGLLQYDSLDISHDRRADGSTTFSDINDWRRKDLYLYVTDDRGWSFAAGYNDASKSWLDVKLSLKTRAGAFTVGQMKTLVGWEDGNTSASATTFTERGLPEQAVYEGRRAGVQWSNTAAQGAWLWQLAWYGHADLNHSAQGNTEAARLVYAPWRSKGHVLHLGVSASREQRDRGSARVRARPEVPLTPVRLVDTGSLQGVDHIDRSGAEAGWESGPLLLQGEYLGIRAARQGAPDARGHGGYVSASWVLTGEVRPYAKSGFGNIKPAAPTGALELAVRYSRLDLDHADVLGGSEHDWTFGVNWYLPFGFKLQANYVRAFSDRRGQALSPHLLDLRAQLAF
ncbi:porin [Oleiagrimonas sp. C23AA]|uniref:OprO/OprP family phosphate-selective porin n=1 Tax=Oleiagrimonas sp. C23AA TaxID=2719047 RepID=UPI00141E022E|nr:porin [Oleiagrimonas sp. C23AA]NII11695.1 porin [Oleiagrimonas sp. C23AA]